MRRREFITVAGGAAIAWPLAAHAQQPTMPVIGFVLPGTRESSESYVAPFRIGLGEAGYVEGRNVAIEYRYADANYTNPHIE
jgi:putative ABC transport system substrate-binding protein